MDISEFEKTLLTNKITPIKLSSDDLHRTRIIDKWTAANLDREMMFIDKIFRIAVLIFIPFQIIQFILFLLLSSANLIVGIRQSIECMCFDIAALFLPIFVMIVFVIVKTCCDYEKITVFQLKNATNYKVLSSLPVFTKDTINLSERAIARKCYYKDPVVVYKLAKIDADIYCGVRQKGKKIQVVFERPIILKYANSTKCVQIKI